MIRLLTSYRFWLCCQWTVGVWNAYSMLDQIASGLFPLAVLSAALVLLTATWKMKNLK